MPQSSVREMDPERLLPASTPVFSRVKVDGDMIKIEDKGEMLNPTSGQVMRPWGADVARHGEVPADRRETFVHWLTTAAAIRFCRRGSQPHLVEPASVAASSIRSTTSRSSNPPSNVPLLDALAKGFRRARLHDRQHVIRTICNSQTYRAARPKQTASMKPIIRCSRIINCGVSRLSS